MFPIINFYKFVKIEDVEGFRLEQQRLGMFLGLKGTILLAPEGINVALSANKEALETYIDTMRRDQRFTDIRVVWSEGVTKPFRKLKVKLKDYIVVFDPAFKVAFDEIHSAPYMDPAEWQKLVKEKRDDVVVLDTRNYYECDYGSFAGADHLAIKHFREFPQKFLEKYSADKDKTFLMFCTGGIRCEKAAVFARGQGFNKVYQLDGGILKYFEDVGKEGYQGSCFVFDDRWAVTAELNQSQDGPHPDQLDRVYSIGTV